MVRRCTAPSKCVTDLTLPHGWKNTLSIPSHRQGQWNPFRGGHATCPWLSPTFPTKVSTSQVPCMCARTVAGEHSLKPFMRRGRDVRPKRVDCSGEEQKSNNDTWELLQTYHGERRIVGHDAEHKKRNRRSRAIRDSQAKQEWTDDASWISHS
jgi:hypothetical protein